MNETGSSHNVVRRLRAPGHLFLGSLVALLTIHALPASAALPVPTSCQIDIDGPNDDPGQKDITQFCVDPGLGTPFELHTSASLDITGLSGSNTADICALFDSDSDGKVNLAVCTSLSQNPAVLSRVRLFTCTNTAADKCTGSVQLNVCTGGSTCLNSGDCPVGETCAQSFDTACEVSQNPTDPFPTGDGYPLDSVAVCAIDLNEFGVAGSGARILDACSYPSSIPNSDPSDCVIYRECTVASQCNDGNACTIDTCQTSTCVHTPNTGASCDDGNICTLTTTCNSQGFCTNGTLAPCDDGNSCTIDTCDAINGCSHAPVTNGTSCDDGQYCTTGDSCTAGVCGGAARNCSDGISCTTDSCNESTDQCVHTGNNASCSNGQYCDGAEVCNPATGCEAGPPVVCSDGISCTLDTCNEALDRCDHAPNDGACNDLQYCNGVETCSLVYGCQAGPPVNCSDGVSCTADSCDENIDQCAHVPNHALCGNGQFCDGAEMCDPVIGCTAGPPIDCGDGIACTTDTCNEATDQCNHAPNNGLCSNDEFCDGVEICDPVTDCRPGTAPNCNDGVSCTTDSCNEATDECDHVPNDAVCSNGQYCDGSETCDPVRDCRPGTPVACDDGVSCTTDTCNESTDQCAHAPDNNVCVNSQFCDGTETCDPVNDCQPGTDPCLPLSCSEVLDQCVTCLIDAQCDNGRFCDGVETCDEATGNCVPGTPAVCNDGISCTTDTCDENANACAFTPSDAACSNGLFCDGVETCNPTSGCQAGTPVVCVDTVACTVDSCNEAQGRCNYVPDNALCSDGQFCNGVEVCSLTLGCRPGTALTCTDGVSCTLDSCNEALDKCEHVPNDALCSDGLFCNGAEVCDPVNRCVSSPPVVCSDGVGCTNDFCNEFDDRCESTPNHALCTNGLYCDGNEICDPVFGCGPGVPVDCSDDNACTANSCYEATDMCLAQDICCGNGLLDIGEECDDGNLTDADGCDSNCKYTRCGNGIVTPGEECEYTEICDNLLDDDEDGYFDCADPDCEVENCTAECELAPPCTCIEEDPAIVLLSKSPNFFRLHGRIPGDVFTIDPQGEGVSIELSNANGMIYQAMLPPNSFVMRSATRFSFKDKTAVTGVDPVGSHAGLAQLAMKFRVVDGVSYLTFKIKAYGDLSAATLPCMTTQVTVGDDLASLRADWTLRKAGAWWLRRGDYVCPSTCPSEPR
jgi:hypothetical protein